MLARRPMGSRLATLLPGRERGLRCGRGGNIRAGAALTPPPAGGTPLPTWERGRRCCGCSGLLSRLVMCCPSHDVISHRGCHQLRRAHRPLGVGALAGARRGGGLGGGRGRRRDAENAGEKGTKTINRRHRGREGGRRGNYTGAFLGIIRLPADTRDRISTDFLKSFFSPSFSARPVRLRALWLSFLLSAIARDCGGKQGLAGSGVYPGTRTLTVWRRGGENMAWPPWPRGGCAVACECPLLVAPVSGRRWYRGRGGGGSSRRSRRPRCASRGPRWWPGGGSGSGRVRRRRPRGRTGRGRRGHSCVP